MSSNLSLYFYYLSYGDLKATCHLDNVPPGTSAYQCKMLILRQEKSATPPRHTDLYRIPRDHLVPMDDVKSVLGGLSISDLGSPLEAHVPLQSESQLEDHLTLVFVDRGIPLAVIFWIPSTNRMFTVNVNQGDTQDSLLRTIKGNIPTSGGEPDLEFYKTSYGNPEELSATTKGQPLNLARLFTEFNDVPFSKFPCVIVVLPTHKRKHHLSWDVVERAKKQKLCDKAPPSIGARDYDSMQANDEWRLCDYRRCNGHSGEFLEEHLPPIEVLFDGFGKFLEVWRSARTPSFKAELVTLDMIKKVDRFVDAMSQVYPDEESRRREGLKILNTIFPADFLRQAITPSEIAPSGTNGQSPRTDGHSLHGFYCIPCIIVEVKNESAGSTAMPIIELAAYYSRMVKNVAQTRPEVVQGSRLPALGITIVGPTITFFGLANVGAIVYVPLTTGLWCLPVECGGSDRHQLYVAFNAASILLASIEQEAKRLTDGSPAPIKQPFYPQIHRLAGYTDPSSSVDFQISGFIEKDLSRHVYIASSSISDLVIKLTRSYSPALHVLCADLSYAPKLLAFERLPGGIIAVAMEYLEGRPLGSLPSSVLAVHRDKWTHDLQAIVKKMHMDDYVHGDLRPPNILCVEDRILLLDFDWGGKVGEASYPHPHPSPQLTTGRDMSSLGITKDDDVRVLEGTLEYMRNAMEEMEGS